MKKISKDIKIQEVGKKKEKFETKREALFFSGIDVFFKHNLKKQSGCFGQSHAQKQPGYYDKDVQVK